MGPCSFLSLITMLEDCFSECQSWLSLIGSGLPLNNKWAEKYNLATCHQGATVISKAHGSQYIYRITPAWIKGTEQIWATEYQTPLVICQPSNTWTYPWEKDKFISLRMRQLQIPPMGCLTPWISFKHSFYLLATSAIWRLNKCWLQ